MRQGRNSPETPHHCRNRHCCLQAAVTAVADYINAETAAEPKKNFSFSFDLAFPRSEFHRVPFGFLR